MSGKITKAAIIFVALLAVLLLAVPFVLGDVFSYCERSGQEDLCLKEKAVEYKDPTLCRYIESLTMRGDCYESMAKLFDDITYCGRISSLEKRGECEMGFVTSIEDLSICDEIKEESVKDDCVDEIFDRKELLEICPHYATDKKKIKCYKEMADDENNASICELILTVRDEEVSCRSSLESACAGGNIEDEVEICKNEFVMEKAEKECNNAYKKFMDKIRVPRSGEFAFYDDEPFTLYMQSADAKTGMVNVVINNEALRAVQQGVPADLYYNKIHLLVTNISTEQPEGAASPIDYVSFCVFTNKKRAEPGEEEEDEEKVEEEEKEEPEEDEEKVEEKSEEELEKDRKKQELIEKLKEKKAELEKEKQESFFYKVKMFFKNLFGGDEDIEESKNSSKI